MQLFYQQRSMWDLLQISFCWEKECVFGSWCCERQSVCVCVWKLMLWATWHHDFCVNIHATFESSGVLSLRILSYPHEISLLWETVCEADAERQCVCDDASEINCNFADNCYRQWQNGSHIFKAWCPQYSRYDFLFWGLVLLHTLTWNCSMWRYQIVMLW